MSEKEKGKLGPGNCLEVKLNNGVKIQIDPTNPSNKRIVGQPGMDNCIAIVRGTADALGFTDGQDDGAVVEQVKVPA